MARTRKTAISIQEFDEVEMTPADKKNLAIIQQALQERGPDYRLVQQLSDKVLRKGMTAGKSVVEALLNVIVDIGDYRIGEQMNFDKKTKKVAIKGLMKLHPNAFDGLHDRLRYAFLKNKDDTTLGLGTALLVAMHVGPDDVDDWFKENINKQDVWKTVYFNITTGALLFDNTAISFVGMKPIFLHHYRRLIDNATMSKMKSVLSNNPFLKSSLMTMTSPQYGNMMKSIFEEIGELMTKDNINEVADILREVNGWSAIQYKTTNRDIIENVNADFIPGFLTFPYIDSKIPSVLLEIDDLSVLGYSFRQYMKYMVRTSLSIDPEYAEKYPGASGNHSEISDMLTDCKDTLIGADNYAQHYKQTFDLIA